MTEDTTEAQEDNVVLTDDEREAFYKAFLSDQPYEEEFDMAKGTFKVKFRTRTLAENDEFYEQVRYDQNNGVAHNDDSYFMKLAQYRAAQGLMEINGEPFQAKVPPEIKKGDTRTRILASQFDNLHLFKVSCIMEAFQLFEKKVAKLSKEIFDADFYKAGE